MKKSLFSLCAALCLVLSLAGTAGALTDPSGDTALETVRVLGILTGDADGSVDLPARITRAEFAKMMTAASVYKDTVGSGYGSSLFRDVKSGHWAGGYIRLAVEQGWLTGYVDGTFRPDSAVTLEEGCAALLRLLGYDAESLAGSYPTAQLSKAGAIGLLDGMTAAQGQALTRRDCATLFYNLLTVQTRDGAVYGVTLGYTISNGEVDYSALVSADTKGPYVTDSGVLDLPFGTDNVTVYRNGAASNLAAAKRYDVYYYNANLRAVWIYSDRVTGTLTAVSPNRAAPASVTVAGAVYEIGTSTAAYKLSSQGGFSDGGAVTLLLGMNGEAVDVISAQEGDTVYYGVVVSSETSAATAATTAAATTSVQSAAQVACTDGEVRTFYHGGGQYSAGRLVSVTVDGSGTTVKSMADHGLSGTVSSDGMRFGGYDLAEDVEILDTDSEGGHVRVYPARLAGAKLSSSDVRLYTLDENGRIDRLILNQATGDTLTYVYLTIASGSREDMDATGTYQYVQDGRTGTITGSTVYDVSPGGAVLLYSRGGLKSIRQLAPVELTQLTDLSAMAGNQKYLLDENVQVLLHDSSSNYYATTLSEINATDYSLRGWYDDLGHSAGGRIRIIVATAH